MKFLCKIALLVGFLVNTGYFQSKIKTQNMKKLLDLIIFTGPKAANLKYSKITSFQS